MAKALYCRSQQLAAGVRSIFLGLSAHATSIIKRLILSTVTLSRKAAKVKPGLAPIISVRLIQPLLKV
jgi:hypothetical protein